MWTCDKIELTSRIINMASLQEENTVIENVTKEKFKFSLPKH